MQTTGSPVIWGTLKNVAASERNVYFSQCFCILQILFAIKPASLFNTVIFILILDGTEA